MKATFTFMEISHCKTVYMSICTLKGLTKANGINIDLLKPRLE
jgi:hypothetical protein